MNTEAAPAISVADLGFSYGEGEAGLEGLTLEVPRGSMLAVVGPNGAGKTTLLGLLCGRLRPRAGSVVVCGLDPSGGDRRELARRVAVVGQQPALGFPFSVLEVVLMGRAPHVEGFRLEGPHDLEAAQLAMEATRVSGLAGRRFDGLSSGERQRVVVARALAQEPELLLLDEPAAFLDIKHETLLYDLLIEMNTERGLTVVSVLHDLNLAALYFERVAMLQAGRLVALGTPEEVVTYQRVREVFGTEVYVERNALTGRPNVLPLSSRVVAARRGLSVSSKAKPHAGDE